MLEPWSTLVATHAVAAVLVVVLGGVNALRGTRGDRPHRWIGRTWTVLMLVVAVSSFWIGGYSDVMGLSLHGLAAVTVVSLLVGVWAARRGLHTTHAWCMVCPYVGLLGALVGVVVVPSRMIPSWFRAHPLPMTAIAVALVATAVLCVVVVLRTVRDRRVVVG